jgi:rhamnosyltransferase
MLATIIITFNPQISQLIDTIKKLNQFNNNILIIDNNSTNKKEMHDYFDFNTINTLNIIFNDINIGLASALNQGFNHFLNREPKIEWVLTLDQDTIISSDYLFVFFDNLKNVNIIKTALVSPKVKLVGKEYKNKEESNLSKSNFAITSGCFTNLSAWTSLGGFDDFLFIDGIDHDYCFRVMKNNLDIIRLNSLIIKQTIGTPKSFDFFGFKKFLVFNHSFHRKFYIVRNKIYLTKKHRMKWSITFLSLIKIFLMIIFFEDNKVKKLHYYLKGIKYGLKS